MLSKLKLNNKGVSPLIATILLVAVSLSLAGILYSWASQNAWETVDSVTKTADNWRGCSSVSLNIEQGCTYNNETLKFIIMDYSTVKIDENITITAIDVNGTIKSTSVNSNFIGKALQINDSDNFKGLAEIKIIRVLIERCPSKVTTTNDCPTIN